MMIDDGLDDGVTALRQEARRQDPAIMVRAALLRRSCDRLGGKHVFQCFWSDAKARVFECFGVSLPPPRPRVFFNVFGIGQKPVFFTVFLRLCTVFAI